ncbi:hypothetical protein SDC9_16562 [bioreactor metagenome]|jgi:hypothetical protein|uniref:DUF3830 family protein n=2 Tax=root TaxID=1 RepID=A0A652ZWH5_9SPIR|nr:DUF3830 family protein [Spirochaetia bacterium]OPX94081.1 MAG: hypothetical protein A4E59_02381 [Syntrophorhabdus sp. PtaB.Bin027]VBB40144.1 conserved hypothetical protein [uncultured Spirochaetota bacterium]HOI22308.1 DUF3830 family protein [Spirochaetales bacterium]
MNRRISIEVLGTNVKAIAELYEDDAPKTCETLWGALKNPLEAKAIHAMYAGPEVFISDFPESNKTFDPKALPLENATAYPSPGDIGWLYIPPHNERGQRKEIWDFAFVYGRGVTFDSVLGIRPITVWAHIVEGLDEFAVQCARIRSDDGPKVLRVKRVER